MLWTISIIVLVVLKTVPALAQPPIGEGRSVTIEAVAMASEDLPRPLVFTNKDWSLTRTYLDVFQILSNQNSCSSFYGGPKTATTVLNDFVALVKSEPLLREVSFLMGGQQRMIHDNATGAFYRLFERTLVNSNGSFYQRRSDPTRRIRFDIGSFAAGTRRARALILLHELGHLIQGENGSWLLPDDGKSGRQSDANTLRVQEVCRAQLRALR